MPEILIAVVDVPKIATPVGLKIRIQGSECVIPLTPGEAAAIGNALLLKSGVARIRGAIAAIEPVAHAGDDPAAGSSVAAKPARRRPLRGERI